MKRRFLISLEILLVILIVVGVNFAFRLLDAPSDASVAAGLGVLSLLFILGPTLILIVRDKLHHPKMEKQNEKPVDSASDR